MSTKKKVFISHIHDEKEIAIAFKTLITKAFLNMIDTFVSSDGESIQMGSEWLKEIDTALTDCVLEVILASPKSVKRPWINFKAGAGWIRKIPVVPLCHGGTQGNLPSPMSALQSADATDASHLELIFVRLAKALGADTPEVDFSDFVAKVKAYEQQSTFWDYCLPELRKVHEGLDVGPPGVLKHLAGLPPGQPLTVKEVLQAHMVGMDTVGAYGVHAVARPQS